MNLSSDYIHPTPNGGRCRVRIFIPDEEADAPVVVLTELVGNPGMSVTNCVEGLAAEILAHHRWPDRVMAVFVEHYEDGVRGTRDDPQTFDLVRFDNPSPLETTSASGRVHRSLGEPRWSALDRETVEVLVGQPVR